MRVIAGTAKGRRLRVPAGLHVRPSGARLRESAFGILEHRGAIEGARVLDLFAGTGALGIEALSRGAASLVAVEQDRSVAKLLQSNVENAGFADRTRVVVQSAERAVAQLPAGESFDLVLIDPPYREGLAQPVLERLELGPRQPCGAKQGGRIGPPGMRHREQDGQLRGLRTHAPERGGGIHSQFQSK